MERALVNWLINLLNSFWSVSFFITARIKQSRLTSRPGRPHEFVETKSGIVDDTFGLMWGSLGQGGGGWRGRRRQEKDAKASGKKWTEPEFRDVERKEAGLILLSPRVHEAR